VTRISHLVFGARLALAVAASLALMNHAIAQLSGTTGAPAGGAGEVPPATHSDTAPPVAVEEFEPGTATAILGKRVRDAAGKDMGMVVDVLVDREGKVRAAVIDFGGFLGVGTRKIAIDWNLVQFNPDNRDAPIVLALNRVEVQAAPEYKPAPQVTKVVAPPPSPERSATVGE
jgi:PRC-barrel domain protein